MPQAYLTPFALVNTHGCMYRHRAWKLIDNPKGCTTQSSLHFYSRDTLMQDTRTYQERSQAFLTKAREELAAGDLEQASEKGWGAAAMMVKAVAEAREAPHNAHYLLNRMVDDLAYEDNDQSLRRFYAVASELHVNFYENRYRERDVRERLDDVEQFIEKMRRILERT